MNDNQGVPGLLYVIAAPSGGGKTSLVAALLQEIPTLRVSVSYTTRTKRPSEIPNVHYFFVDPPAFEALIANDELLEYAHVHGHYYGTSRGWVADMLAQGNDVILEIDWQGAEQIKRHFPDSVGIFILPPSRQVLEQRLRDRGEDAPAIIAGRLVKAREEIAHCSAFDYLVVNDDFDLALEDLKVIVHANKLRLAQQQLRQQQLLHDLLTTT